MLKYSYATLLSLFLIFLNTLNHNPSVPSSRKLSKDQFINQYVYSNPPFPVKKLEDIYHRIMTNQFKTDIQYVEKIYERIRAFNHEETTKDTIKRSANILQAGEQIYPYKSIQRNYNKQLHRLQVHIREEYQYIQHFLKFGRMGKPHMRFVYVSDDEECIFWCQLSEEAALQQRAREGLLEDQYGGRLFGKSKIKCIKCEDIVDIKVGYNKAINSKFITSTTLVQFLRDINFRQSLMIQSFPSQPKQEPLICKQEQARQGIAG